MVSDQAQYFPALDLDSLRVNLDAEVMDLLGLSPQAMPLRSYFIYGGEDLDRAGICIEADIGQSHRFEFRGSRDDFELRIYRARLSTSQLVVTYNSQAVRLSSGLPANHYTLVIPLSGTYTEHLASGEIPVTPGYGIFRSANNTLRCDRSQDYVAILLSLSLRGFETYTSDDLELVTAPEQPYSLRFDLRDAGFRPFCSLLSTLLALLDAPETRDSLQDKVISKIEQALWYQFFISFPEVYEAHQKHRSDPMPAPVQRVVAYISEHLGDEISMADLVKVSGASQRTLHAGFKASYSCGPMAYVRRCKLEQCRQQLLGADPADISVTDAAAEWGFYHMSNFARYYRQEFGELPSDTLRVLPSE